MTTKPTDHQLKMCTLAGGYSIYGLHGVYYHKEVDPETKLLVEWNPLSPEDSQNLMADARIDVTWGKRDIRETVSAFHVDTGECTIFIDQYPSATEAMRWAIFLCAVAKGEAMLKEEDDG